MSVPFTENLPNDVLLRRFFNLNQQETAAGHNGNSPLEKKVIELLERHPHFRGKTRFVKCEMDGGCLRLEGCLPSYFLKQLVQEALRELPEIERIDNRIFVIQSLEQYFASQTKNELDAKRINATGHVIENS